MAWKCHFVLQGRADLPAPDEYPGGGYRTRHTINDSPAAVQTLISSIFAATSQDGKPMYCLPYIETEGAYGMNPLDWIGKLIGTNPAANGGQGNGLVHAIAAGGAEYVELGNEIDNMGPKGQGTVVVANDRAHWDDYADRLQQSAQFFRKAGVGVIMSSHDNPTKTTYMWDHLNSIGAFKYVDGVAIHVYSGGERAPDATGVDPGAKTAVRSMEKVTYARNRLNAIGYPKMDLWITEVGWNTEDTSGEEDDKTVSWLQQGHLLHRGDGTGIFERMLAQAQSKRIRMVSWFTHDDFQTTEEDQNGDPWPVVTVRTGRALPPAGAAGAPFSLDVDDLTPGAFNGTLTSGSKVITAVGSFVKLQVGMSIRAAGLPANSEIDTMNEAANTITIKPAAATASGARTFSIGFPYKGVFVTPKNVVVTYTGLDFTTGDHKITGCTASADTTGPTPYTSVAAGADLLRSKAEWAHWCGIRENITIESPATKKPAWDRMVVVGSGPGLAGVAPAVTTEDVVSPGGTTATLPGTVDPNGAATEFRFEYGTTVDYGSQTPWVGIGSGSSPVAVSFPVTPLIEGQLYHYRVIAQNEAGQAFGPDKTFTTTIGGGGATVHLTPTRNIVGPGGVPIQTDEFVDGTESPEVPLLPGTTYYYRLVATNSAGTSKGNQQQFTTLAIDTPPQVATGIATGITDTQAVLNAGVNPNGDATLFHFEYGTDPGLSTFTATGDQSGGSGTTSISRTQLVTGLTQNTHYFFRVVAINSFGTTIGLIQPFTTPVHGGGAIGRPGATDVSPARFFDVRAAPKKVVWEFHLADSHTMTRLGLITQARDRQLQLVLNKPGSLSFTVPVKDPMFAEVEPIKFAVIAYRNALPIWSGPIVVTDDSMPGRISVNCAGWFEILNRRLMRQAVSYPKFATPPLTITGGQIVFDNSTGVVGEPDFYPGGLLGIANAQQDTWISEGTTTDQMNRVISYERGQNIGEAITQLTEIEAGFDFTIDPITRVMNIKNWDEYPDKSDEAVFGFNWGPNNLASLGRQLDSTSMANRVTAMGTYGGGLAEDLESQAAYQLFEEITDLSSVVDPNVLLAFAGGEVVLRSRPRVTYSLAPFPWSTGRIPEPFVDFGLGDAVKFSAKYGPRIDIENQKVRVFGMSVSITNEGNEKLGPLQVTP